MRIHPVFHVSLLAHAANDPLPGQHSPPAPAVIVDGEEEWEVERILDSRYYYNHLQYLTKWKGYDAPTWQPVEDMEHASDAVLDFHRLYPEKPRPVMLAGASTKRGGNCHGRSTTDHSTATSVDRTPGPGANASATATLLPPASGSGVNERIAAPVPGWQSRLPEPRVQDLAPGRRSSPHSAITIAGAEKGP